MKIDHLLERHRKDPKLFIITNIFLSLILLTVLVITQVSIKQITRDYILVVGTLSGVVVGAVIMTFQEYFKKSWMAEVSFALLMGLIWRFGLALAIAWATK